jgi:hypothetical protein
LSIVEPLVALLLLGAPAPAPAGVPDARIRQWVADLAREDFAAREAASKALVEAGEAAVPALQEAAKDPSPEVQGRAREALKAIANRKIQPGKVLEILHGSAAFVEGGNLALRDALKPLEKLGLRVDYDQEVDPAQPCSLTKHGQTALELVDQIAEMCRLGFRIVPGGVRVVTKPALDVFHEGVKKQLQVPVSLERVQAPVGEVLLELEDVLGVPVVLFPGVKEEGKEIRTVTFKVQDLPVSGLLQAIISMQGFRAARAEVRYGLVVLPAKKE